MLTSSPGSKVQAQWVVLLQACCSHDRAPETRLKLYSVFQDSAHLSMKVTWVSPTSGEEKVPLLTIRSLDGSRCSFITGKDKRMEFIKFDSHSPQCFIVRFLHIIENQSSSFAINIRNKVSMEKYK